MTQFRIAQAPGSYSEFEQFIDSSAAELVENVADASALIWHDYNSPEKLFGLLKVNPQLAWVQLPFAGVDNFAGVLEWIHVNRPNLAVTSAKGSYSEPVAEHALAMALSLGRGIPTRVKAKSWGEKFAISLFDSEVLIFGGGGITRELIQLLKPFRANITVLRRKQESIDGAARVLPSTALLTELPKADFVFLTSALTQETKGIFDKSAFDAMKSSGFLINVARGGLVATDDLIWALFQGVIGGAGVDVTDPEPLPDSSQLWKAPNVIITPHSADTPEMVFGMFGERVRKNVAAFSAGEPLVGLVDLELGY